jgi:transposase-like protein
VLEEVREWQNRPLDPVYPVIFFDALRVKIRDEGLVRNKAVYVALALNSDGEKQLLALLNAEEIGITLSEEDQLDPEQSTSAIVLHHPQAKYFSV